MAAPAPQAPPQRPSTEAIADVVLTVLMLALFGWGFLEAADWSFKAALFPRIVTGVGLGVSALHLLQALLRLRRDRSPSRAAAPSTAEDDVDEDDVEYVFQTAGARRWTEAVAWVAGFFVLLYVAGLFVTAPLFSLLYLRVAGHRSWAFGAAYAVVLGAVLYLAFEVLLGIPVPPGLLLG